MSKEPEMTRRGEIETLLPFYLNGTLAGEDLLQVEDWLANDPAAEDALMAAESEMALVSADNEAIRPRADAFKRFSESLEKEASPRASPASRLSAFFASTFAIPAPWILAAAAAALVLMVVAVQNIGSRAPEDIQVAGTGETANIPFVLITFTPAATLSDMATLLKDNGGQIAGGPISGATFKVAFPVETAADYEKLSRKLAASPLVEKVTAGKKPDAPQ
jgi:hypothetical protein